MLRLHVASTSNEVTVIIDCMRIGIKPTGSMSEPRQSNIKQRLSLNLVLRMMKCFFQLILRLHVASTSN